MNHKYPDSEELPVSVDFEDTSSLLQRADSNTETVLKNIRLKKLNRIGHLNINSIRNKFGQSFQIINNSVDVLLVSETKINSSFPAANFFIQVYAIPCRLERTADGDAIFLYIRDNVSSILMQNKFRIEGILLN